MYARKRLKIYSCFRKLGFQIEVFLLQVFYFLFLEPIFNCEFFQSQNHFHITLFILLFCHRVILGTIEVLEEVVIQGIRYYPQLICIKRYFLLLEIQRK